MEEKIIYKSGEIEKGFHDLQVYKYEGLYEMTIEENIFYNSIEDLKAHYLTLLNGCKEFIKNKYRLISKDKKVNDDFKICEIEWNESYYSMHFNEPEFEDIESVYNWVCKAIKQINN